MLALITVILSILCYYNTNFYISKHAWKYSHGDHFGDWIEFNREPVELRDREIYKNEEQVAFIKFCTGRHLVISSVKAGTLGFYAKKTLTTKAQ
jgi:hypothetical protein